MTSRRRWTAVGLGLLMLAAGAAATGSGSASATTAPTPPPWQVPAHLDPNEVGTLSLYDASGNVVTTGSVNDLPLSAYQLGSGAGRVGDNKATLFAATPAFGVAPGAWPLSQMSTASSYPNPAAPAALAASTFPLHASTSLTDFNLASYIAAHPNNDTTHPGYIGVYELRMKTSALGAGISITYNAVDVLVSGTTWTQLYPAPVVATPSLFTAVTPCRVFDTRVGPGSCTSAPSVPVKAVGPGGVLAVKVTGMGNVPADATAVVLNVTAVGATASTFISVYPASPTPPKVSNLNVASSAPVPNLTVVPVGPGGVVDFFNDAGSVNLIGDVSGYFSAAGASAYTAAVPCRVFDTRLGTGGCTGSPTFTAGLVGPKGVLKVKVTAVAGVPDTATAVVLNVTAVSATHPGTYVSVYPDSPTQPAVSNLNVNSAAPVPNLVIVPVGPGGVVDFYNAAGSINLLGDLAGWFAPGTSASYTTTGPCRVFDTRSGTGVCPGAATFTAAKIGPQGILKVKVTGVGGVPANATAVVLNITAVGATKPGTFIAAYPDSPTVPTVSNLNVNSSGAIPNLAIVQVGPGGVIDFYNATGTVNLIGDVAGYFAP
jgi:hypothetical protein